MLLLLWSTFHEDRVLVKRKFCWGSDNACNCWSMISFCSFSSRSFFHCHVLFGVKNSDKSSWVHFNDFSVALKLQRSKYSGLVWCLYYISCVNMLRKRINERRRFFNDIILGFYFTEKKISLATLKSLEHSVEQIKQNCLVLFVFPVIKCEGRSGWRKKVLVLFLAFVIYFMY